MNDEAAKESKRRAHIISEIISTEDTYVRLLTELSKEMTVFQSLEVANHSENSRAVKEVAIGVVSIHALQVQFLGELKLNLRTATAQNRNIRDGTTGGSPAEVEAVAKTFAKYGKFFKLYITYMTHYYQAVDYLITSKAAGRRILHQSRGEKQSLEQILSSVMAKLILPIQRVPRYVLLLKELLKHSEELSHAKIAVKSSLHMTEKVAAEINLAMAKREKDEELLKLRSLFLDKVDLVAPHRNLLSAYDVKLLEDPQRVVSNGLPSKVILFNDMMLIGAQLPRLFAYVGVCIFGARNLMAMDANGLRDPYAKISIIDSNNHVKNLGRTPIIKETLDPVWRSAEQPPVQGDTYFDFLVSGIAYKFPQIIIQLYDKDVLNDHKLGLVKFNLRDMVNLSNDDSGKLYKFQSLKWHQLRETRLEDRGNHQHGDIKIKVEIVYAPYPEITLDTQKFQSVARKILGYSKLPSFRSARTIRCPALCTKYRVYGRVPIDSNVNASVRIKDTSDKKLLEIDHPEVGRYLFSGMPAVSMEQWVQMIREHGLAAAVQRGDAKSVIRYLKSQNVDPNTPLMNTRNPPLMIAVTKGSLEITRQLIKHKADINYAGEGGETPLIKAAKLKTTSSSLVKLLIQKKADPELEDRVTCVCIHVCVYSISTATTLSGLVWCAP